MQKILFMLLAFVVAGVSVGARADYPDRPMRLIVPFPPGGGTDIVARLYAQKLSEAWRQSVVIDNRGGAGGNLGTELVARSAPDGHTMLIVISSFTVNPSLFKDLSWHPVKDFAPVSKVGSSAYILTVHPGVQAKTVSELVALARAKPDVLSFSSSGIGSPLHLAGELLNVRANIKMVHVPYKGAGPAMVDLLAGRVQLMFSSSSTSLGHMRTGKLRGLATTNERRLAVAPDLPTMAEAGVKDCIVEGWYGILVPAGTPRDRVQKLSSQLAAIARMPDIQGNFAKDGREAMASTPEEFAKFIAVELAQWSQVVRAAGIKAE